VLVARDGQDVADHVRGLTPGRAKAVGEAALKRVLSEHTYAHRGAQVDALLREQVTKKRVAEVVAA
jgi:spore maturation protein CgeB